VGNILTGQETFGHKNNVPWVPPLLLNFCFISMESVLFGELQTFIVGC
jgi:hypothetical protein